MNDAKTTICFSLETMDIAAQLYHNARCSLRSLDAKVLSLDFCHSAVRMMEHDTFDVHVRQRLGNPAKRSWKVWIHRSPVSVQFVFRELFGV